MSDIMVKLLCTAATALAILVAAPVRVAAQDVYPPPAEANQQLALAPAALDQLVAPVALYPDTLLAQLLAASTYPLEVVQAHRWIEAPRNASLADGALTEAVAAQNWDPSVQALIPFPQVLQLMDEHLDWTEQLGEAFLAQPDDVMNAVQRLRHRAEQAGSLRISAQQSVVDEGDDIAIASPDDQSVYVPAYDPQCAYGPWPYPAAGPVDFGPWTSACGAEAAVPAYNDATYLPFGFFLWAGFDWRHHCIRIDRARFALAHPDRGMDGDVWRHDPAHRRGASYTMRANAQHFAGAERESRLARTADTGLSNAYDFAPPPSRSAGHAPHAREGFGGNPGGPHLPQPALVRAPAPPGHAVAPVQATPVRAVPGRASIGH